MDDKVWQKLYDNVSPVPKPSTIVGFNVNLDRIISVTPSLLTSAFFNQPVLSELRSRLQHSMRTCTAEEWFVDDYQLYAQFKDLFTDSGHLAIGGQAGIAAVHLATIGVSDVLCIVDSPGPETINILECAGVHVMDLNESRRESSDSIHLVFEYTPGLVPVDDGVIPRNNRFIVSPHHPPESFLISGNKKAAFSTGITPYTRAFLSGYQYLQSDEEFCRAADQCLLMKKTNEWMQIHVECVSVTLETVINGFFNHILPVVDSIGLNEHELVLLLQCLDSHIVKNVCCEKISPVQLVEGAMEICTMSGLKRLHLHTFGYYVLVIRNDCAHPEASFNGLLFASQTVAQAAQGTQTEISPLGISAFNEVAKSFGPVISPGIFRTTTYMIVMIPTIIVKDITKSSGLGDILSSSAFIADEF